MGDLKHPMPETSGIICNDTIKADYTTKQIVKKESGRFNRELLPMPIVVLDKLGIKTGKANKGGYWIIQCPVHSDGKEKNPSLNLHQITGGFRCFTCGITGDLLDFYMLVTGKPFREAAKALGAWEFK